MTLSEVLVATIDPKIWQVIDSNDWRHGIPAVKSLLSQFSQAPDTDTDEGHETRTRTETMSLHDALAKILVSEERSEVIAVGSALSAEEITIFVASDENHNLPQMVEQLRRLWDKLKEIRRNRVGGTLVDNSIKLGMEFRGPVYEYCWKKHQRRYDTLIAIFPHLERVFDELLDNSSFVTDKHQYQSDAYADGNSDSDDGELGGEVAYVTTDELPIIKCMRVVCQCVRKCKLEPSSENFLSLGKFTAFLNHALDDTLYDLFPRLASIYSKVTNEVIRFSIRRAWGKLLALEHVIKQVLRLGYSKRLGALLDRHFNIVAVQTDTVHLKFDVLEDPIIREVVEEAGWTREEFEKRWKYIPYKKMPSQDTSVHPHCGCALLEHFIKNILARGDAVVPFEYIGLSKELCIGCRLYFFAYNTIAEQHGLPAFHTRGSKTKTKTRRAWAKPRGVPSQIDQDIEVQMAKNGRKVFVEILRAEERKRKHDMSDSFDLDIYALLEQQGILGFDNSVPT